MNEFPLHWCIFQDDLEGLINKLTKISKNEIDKKDLRGKTPLELAVFLNNTRCAKLLIENGADCGIITKAGWNLVQESVSTGNAELVKLIYSHRDLQRESIRSNGIPDLLNKLKQAPDFYVEMKWEFTSWIPLISKACPGDVYKIYKNGSNVRIDTTLIGFNGSAWERGNRSYIFQADKRGSATLVEIDHLLKTYHVDKLIPIEGTDESSTDPADILYEPDDYLIQTKLTSPNIVTFLDIEKIEFERNRSGIWGWRSDKNETINGHECKVYTANNLQLITKTRIEHLDNERARAFIREVNENNQQNEATSNPNVPSFLKNFFQGNEQHIKIDKKEKKLTALEYFQKQIHVDYYLNGTVRKIDETQKIQSFNANISLSDSYPLSLREQVLPIVDLMALNNSHFKKLKEFITLQLPSGFPVKIEIPLYRVINAKVTFGNIHASDNHVEHVHRTIVPFATNLAHNSCLNFESTCTSDTKNLISDDDSDSPVKKNLFEFTHKPDNKICRVDESIFTIPTDYKCMNKDYSSLGLEVKNRGASRPIAYNARYNQSHTSVDDDEIMLQIAIQQSLAVNQLVTDILPARDSSGSTQSFEEYQSRQNSLAFSQREDILLQKALEESLRVSNINLRTDLDAELGVTTTAISGAEENSLLKTLMDLSRREAEEQDQILKQEEEELQQILALSLIEK